MKSRRPARALRAAIDEMPLHTREAMLQGINVNPIIVGAYTDKTGGVCPMLAAHRNGGRTSFAEFALAWDRYTKAHRPRRATEREVDTLRTMLEASIAIEGCKDLAGAIEDHRAILRSRVHREEYAVDRTRGGKIKRILPQRKPDAMDEAIAQLLEVEERKPAIDT